MKSPTQQPKARLRARRIARADCVRSLGKTGNYLLWEFLGLHGRTPIRTVTVWAEALTRQYGDRGTMLSKAAGKSRRTRAALDERRGRIGAWATALLKRDVPHSSSDGLCFYLRRIDLRGTPPKGLAPWRAVLLLAFERQTGSLFHHVINTDGRWGLRPDSVWHLVDRATRTLCAQPRPYPKVPDEVISAARIVFLPSAIGSDIRISANAVFADAVEMLERHRRAGTKMVVRGAPSHSTVIDPGQWSAHQFQGRPPVHLQLGMSYLDFREMLTQEAQDVTEALRLIRREFALGETPAPSTSPANRTRFAARVAPAHEYPSWRQAFQTRQYTFQRPPPPDASRRLESE